MNITYTLYRELGTTEPPCTVEDRLTLILDNSITCELYVMSKVMYQLLVKYTVYRWVSLRSFLAPLQIYISGASAL